MRLIDAEKLVEDLQKWDTPASKSLYNFAMDRIIGQPIVYDTDKVVAEMEKARAPIYRADGSIMCEKRNIEIDRAIQIVKGGGVDG